jgi:hypothetical protein
MASVTKLIPAHPFHNKTDAELSRLITRSRFTIKCLDGLLENEERKLLADIDAAIKVLGYRAAVEYVNTYGI